MGSPFRNNDILERIRFNRRDVVSTQFHPQRLVQAFKVKITQNSKTAIQSHKNVQIRELTPKMCFGMNSDRFVFMNAEALNFPKFYLTTKVAWKAKALNNCWKQDCKSLNFFFSLSANFSTHELMSFRRFCLVPVHSLFVLDVCTHFVKKKSRDFARSAKFLF